MIDASDDPYGSALDGLGATKIVLKKPLPPKTTVNTKMQPDYSEDFISPTVKRYIIVGSIAVVGGAIALMIFKRITRK